MPRLSKSARYVDVAYELHCGYERATALSNDLNEQLRDDDGFFQSKDDTRGWDGDRMAVVVVTYNSLEAAVRLDTRVRELLSRKASFTYEARVSTSMRREGPCATVRASTTLSPLS